MIDNRDVTALPPRSRDIAMVFQDYALYPHMSIQDNIGYPLKVRGTSREALSKAVQEVAVNLQISELLSRRPSQLSGGQQQRAAVARAVVYQAKVFLFDEPLSNLDAKLRLEARAFLKHLQQNVNITAVYVTHDQAEAMALADRIVVMNKGLIMQVGTPLEIYRRPANTFVASFIGNPPMNLLSCTFADGKIILESKSVKYPVSINAANLPKHMPTDSTITLGIRPEHITLHAAEMPNSVAADLYVTQVLGGESLVIVKLGDQLVSVRVFDDELPTYPSKVWMTFDERRMYFYDTEGNILS
jgi:ABC-type sugar transport system ATPase subunit